MHISLRGTSRSDPQYVKAAFFFAKDKESTHQFAGALCLSMEEWQLLSSAISLGAKVINKTGDPKRLVVAVDDLEVCYK